MFHISAEGSLLRNGFNFYPWKDRKTVGIGVRLVIKNRMWAIRYSPERKRIFYWKAHVTEDYKFS